MAAVIDPKLGLAKLTDMQLDNYTQDKIDALTGNANFPSPSPTLATVNSKLTAYRNAIAKAMDGSKADTENKNKLRGQLETLVTKLANNCATVADGDTVKFLTSGFAIKGKKTPKGLPGQVQNLSLKTNDNDGELVANWKPESKSASYEVEVSPQTDGGFLWKPYKTVTASKLTLKNLASGVKHWVRVRGVNASGEGAWSDPAVKMVP